MNSPEKNTPNNPQVYPEKGLSLTDKIANRYLLFLPEGFRTYDELIKEYQQNNSGGVFELGGAPGNYVVADKETAVEALRVTPRHPLHNSEKLVLGEEGLFTLPNGELHRSKRLQIAEYFTDATVRKVYFENLGNYVLTKVTDFISEAKESEGPIDTSDFARTVAVGSMISTIIPLNWDDAQMIRFSKHILSAEMYAALLPKQVEGLLPHLAKDLHYFEDQVIDLLAKLTDSNSDEFSDSRFGYMKVVAKNLVDSINGSSEENWPEITRQKAMEVLGILTAGEITTYATIESAMVFLGSNPQVVEVLREQIRNQWPQPGSADLNHTKLREIPILEKIVDYLGAEVPPIPDIFRGTGEGVTLSGLELKPNSTVHIPVRALFRTGKPFDPTQDYENLMFGTGERVCLGAPLAKFEIMATILFMIDQCDVQGVTLTAVKQDPTLENVVAGFSALHPKDARVTFSV